MTRPITPSSAKGAEPAGRCRQKDILYMTTQIFDAPGDLFLGSDPATARALGARRFGTAAKAVRFAMEHAAPVSLRGALLRVDGQNYGPRQIRALHRRLVAAAGPDQARAARLG